MLLYGLFILLTAAALPSINVSPLQLARCATLIFLSAGALAANALNIPAMGLGVNLYDGILQATPITQSVDIFLCVVASIIVGFVWSPYSSKISIDSVNTSVPAVSEYSVILLFTTLGASILVSSTNLVTLYLGLELQSFAVYVLASLYRNSETASSAALKYFFIGGLSSAFILMGGAVVYWQTGSTDLWHVFSLINQLSSDRSNLVNLQAGILLGLEAILLGILIKTAAAPFYNWAPDVYDGVPTVVTTWLTLIPKISLLIFVLHITVNLSNIEIQITWYTQITWSTILATTSMLSLIIGTVVGLAQVRVKRLLAYSTISHVGFILLALSVNTEIGVDAFTFYMFQYTITTLNAFLILLAFGYCIREGRKQDNRAHNTDIEFNRDIAGQFYVNPVLGFAFSACLFSIAGVPPLVGFFGKQAVLSAAMQSGYGFLAFVGIVTSVVSASYYLGLVRTIHFESPISLSNTQPLALTSIHSYTISTLTLFVTIFILAPSFVLDSTSLLALAFHSV